MNDYLQALENAVLAAKVTAHVRELIEENARLRAMLRQLEWCDTDTNAFAVARDGVYTAHRCPICNCAQEAGEGHASDCELAALLRETADA